MKPLQKSAPCLFVASFSMAAAAQDYSAAVECTAGGSLVNITMSGSSPNTCTPSLPQITLADGRIDFVLDDREPPGSGCFDMVTPWCRNGVVGPLSPGYYEVFTTILPDPPVQRPPVIVDHATCADRALPAPLTGGTVNGAVHAMIVWDPDDSGPARGLLIVGGAFSLAGGVPASNIAAWDGMQWQALGAGLFGGPESIVYSLATFGGELIAGGRFEHAGNVPAANIASWNGSQWQPLDSGIIANDSVPVWAMTNLDESLIVGGNFVSAGGIGTNCIARWDGAAWHPLGDSVFTGPVFFIPPRVTALASYDGMLIAGGHFTAVGDLPATNMAHWDGLEWQPMDAGLSLWSPVTALTIFQGAPIVAEGTCLYGCSSHARRWDGIQWQSIGAGLDGQPVSAFAEYNGTLLAATGDRYFGSRPCPSNGVVQWNGLEWTLLNSADGPIYSLANVRGRLIAGGRFERVAGIPVPPNIVRWRIALLVPAEYPTIQADIDAAQSGDLGLVADGTYNCPGNRNMDFGGKDITVQSASGDPNACIIDCSGSPAELQ